MMNVLSRGLCSLGLFCVSVGQIRAGGSGLNVIIVVNQNSTNSVQLGNYYAERRQIPPQNYLRINWTNSNVVDWTDSDFATYLYNPLLSMLSSRQLTNQADYVVLSMDIPYRVNSGAIKPNSTTSSLFYGFKPDPNTDPSQCSMAPGSTNLYAGSESIFGATPPINASSNSWLVAMITHSNLALAKQIVDSGVLSDGTFPTQTVYLAKSSDVNRNVRYITFDNAIFNTRLRSNYSMQRTNTDLNWIFGSCLGLQQGVQRDASMPGTTFVPGSMADDLTSYGGNIFEPADHLKILQYLTFGAAGGYGTVSEPCNYLEKFPSPQNYFYQSRGFSLAECYYQSLTNPYQGVIVGEPLAAPFAKPPVATWNNLPANSLLSGTTNLTLQATAADGNHPVQQLDLFLDGLWLQTLTNAVPTRSNLLNVTINGQSVNYLVPLNATIKSVTSGLTAALNTVNNATKVAAFAHGDRIELRSSDRSKTGAQVSVSVSNSIGAGTAATTWITTSRSNLLDTVASGIRNVLFFGNPVSNSFLQAIITKTNAAQFAFGVTNSSGTMTLTQMAQQLIDLINGSPDLNGADGLTCQDLLTDAVDPTQATEFNLQANSAGWNAAQIQASLTGSFTIIPSGTLTLEDNLHDLEPRDHVYVTAGVTNLPLTFALNTTSLANGAHELSAVAYEGSHVRTQKRVTQNIIIQNGALSATFTSLTGTTNFALEGTLQFSATANTNNIATIELFSTGGSLGIVTGQSTAMFSINATNLDLGLHPFYALVTGSNGKQYRTETKWFRIVGTDMPFVLSIMAPPPTLTWPATAGRSYDVLSTINFTNAFQIRASLVPTSSVGQWTDTNVGAVQRFYRVRTSN